MNQQARQDIDSGDTFEGDLAQLLGRIRKSEWARSKLCRIVADGLKVVKKIDDSYRNDRSFTNFSLYPLYKIAFEVWSYQHQALLQSLETSKPQQLTSHSQLVLQHQDVVIKMFDALNHLASANDQDSLRDSWLSVWRQTIFELAQFVDPKVYPVKPKKPNLFRFSLRMRLPDMSPDTKFAILATCLLVLGIVIATLLLIRN
ncbi:MAG: hypothetical protein JGK04_23515 [Microcoleus sp. PH2017_39_LGB_O_B]|uniref:hypothetical protein n=1 Tax=unclassified Microcoleus TaxID=2642155 RepID=UPI001D50A00C|nr:MULTISPECIES: hypothetical protein [unclassified Microcoleus]MCC3450408.1 hypothetical protein [Microcoleus sp. PH2017_09_SFU_O_A]MCC3631307.1 hypothetical protein [Microcoleus sp. PH2017_39_LGB_O_B]MCC3643524.1 hypothetical protein [Microcoleus sp. PH2017_33_LGB_O_A]TAF87160.1 MAG: hypothetical protein EAZ49_21005 [Oscillatoriales cyanobacterium]